MLSTFPQQGGVDSTLAAYLALVDDFEAGIVAAVCERFAKGGVPGQNTRFAPSGPEFVAECRKQVEIAEIRNQPKLPPVKPAVRVDYLDRLDGIRSRYAHRKLLATNIDHAAWLKLCGRNEFPVGATFVAATGEVYR